MDVLTLVASSTLSIWEQPQPSHYHYHNPIFLSFRILVPKFLRFCKNVSIVLVYWNVCVSFVSTHGKLLVISLAIHDKYLFSTLMLSRFDSTWFVGWFIVILHTWNFIIVAYSHTVPFFFDSVTLRIPVMFSVHSFYLSVRYWRWKLIPHFSEYSGKAKSLQ